jgi:hypothetical protein
MIQIGDRVKGTPETQNKVIMLIGKKKGIT